MTAERSPARYFAEHSCRVTGVDLSEEFIRAAKSLTRKVGLDQSATFYRRSALELPFDSNTFDGAYEIHVGMNIADKTGVFKEVARVLKKNGCFAIFDIMRTAEGALSFPLPWAVNGETSFVATPEGYGERPPHSGASVRFQMDSHRIPLLERSGRL